MLDENIKWTANLGNVYVLPDNSTGVRSEKESFFWVREEDTITTVTVRGKNGKKKLKEKITKGRWAQQLRAFTDSKFDIKNFDFVTLCKTFLFGRDFDIKNFFHTLNEQDGKEIPNPDAVVIGYDWKWNDLSHDWDKYLFVRESN